MNLLQIVSSPPFSWSKGGPARSTWNIAKNLAKKHQVVIYSTDLRSEGSPHSIKKDGVTLYRFSNINKKIARKYHTFSPQFLVKLNKKIKNFDLIHIHEYRTFQALATCYLAKRKKVPYILEPRGSFNRINKRRTKKIFDQFYGHNMIKDSKRIILSSGAEYSLAKPLLNESGLKNRNQEINFIPNGIDIEIYRDLPPKKTFRKKYSIEKNKKIILFLGRINRRKGIDFLIDAFKDFEEEMNAVLVIVGPDDGYKEELEKKIRSYSLSEKVIFTGPLYGDYKLSAFTSADVFVFPSKDQRESFGNVVLEASACGTTSVVTDVCGVSEWVENTIKTKPAKKALEKKIRKGLEKSSLGEKARKEVLENFTWGKISEMIENTYKNVINP